MIKENEHQKALRKWIAAGLHIPEVANLNGDAGYIFNNMIAKYTLSLDKYAVSLGAFNQLMESGVDFEETHIRRKFYGRNKPYMYEHAIPARVIREALLSSDRKEDTVKNILRAAGKVTVVLRTEDALLKAAGLSSRMPDGWKLGDNPDVRYREVGIVISGHKLKVKGAIVR